MSKVIFTSFAGGSTQFRASADRIRREAIESGFFDLVYVYDDLRHPKNLKEFFKKNSAKLIEKGYGFWAWKPYLLLDVFKSSNNGDVIVYADSGCQISNFGKSKLLSNLLICRTYGTLFFKMPGYIEKNWTKKKLLECLGVLNDEKILDSPQVQATYFYIEVNDYNQTMLLEWADLCVKENFAFINDDESTGVNNDTFCEHRHDQSILSVIVKKYRMHIQNYECHFRSIDYFINSKVLLFPIHSIRNRSSESKYYFAFKFSSLERINSSKKFSLLCNKVYFLINYLKVAFFFLIKRTMKVIR